MNAGYGALTHVDLQKDLCRTKLFAYDQVEVCTVSYKQHPESDKDEYEYGTNMNMKCPLNGDRSLKETSMVSKPTVTRWQDSTKLSVLKYFSIKSVNTASHKKKIGRIIVDFGGQYNKN